MEIAELTNFQLIAIAWTCGIATGWIVGHGLLRYRLETKWRKAL